MPTHSQLIFYIGHKYFISLNITYKMYIHVHCMAMTVFIIFKCYVNNIMTRLFIKNILTYVWKEQSAGKKRAILHQ